MTNFGWLSFGRILGNVAIFALMVVIARWHGDAGLGAYAFAMAAASFFAVAADSGIYIMLLREISHTDDTPSIYFGRILSLGIYLSMFALIALFLFGYFASVGDNIFQFVIILGVMQIIQKLAEGSSLIFLVLQKAYLGAYIEIIGRIAGTLLAIMLIVMNVPLAWALVVLPTFAVCRLVAVYIFISRCIGCPVLNFNIYVLLTTMKSASLYAISAFQVPVQSKADVVILGFLVNTATVGIYNAAFRIVVVFYDFASLLSLSLLPLLSKLYATAEDEMGMAYQATLRASILLTLPAAAGLWLIAPDLIILIFGPEFVDSVEMLRVLCGVVVAFPLRSLLGGFLVARGLQATRAKIEWFGAGATVIGCLVLVVALGGVGAAMGVVLAEIVMVIMMMHRLAAFWGWPDAGLRVGMSVIGIAAFFLPAWLWPALPVFLVIPSAILIYVGVLALSAEIRNTEFRMVRSVLERKSGAPLPFS